jgi:hypothetical protein
MPKNVRLEIFKFDEEEYRLIVYVDNNFFTEHKNKDPKLLLIEAHEYLVADYTREGL